MTLFKRFTLFTKEVSTEILQTSLDLFKLMIPIVILVKLIEMAGGMQYLANILAPFMHPLGLPAELGLVWAAALISNIYTGLILFVSLPIAHELSVAQVSTLGLLILIAHSFPIEHRIVQKIGVKLWFSVSFRFCAAYSAATLYYQASQFFKFSQTPADLLWEPMVEHHDLWQWALAQCKTFVQIFLIITVLILLLRLLQALSIDRLIQSILRPIMPLLGLSDKAINVTLVGMTLGLTFGGSLLIQEGQQGKLSASELFFAVCLLLILHALIEDTLLILLLGANVHAILSFRLLFSFVLVAIGVFILRKKNSAHYERWYLNQHFIAPQQIPHNTQNT